MKQSFEDFLFSKEERNAVQFTMIFIMIACLVTGIVFFTSEKILRPVVFGFLMAFAVILGYLSIEHFCNDKYRSAKYIISENSIILKCGNDILDVSMQDEYYVSIIHLYKPSGRSYMYRPCIVFWKNSEPVDGVHPLHLLKKNCVVLPLTDRTEAAVRSFTGIYDLPEYPKSFYHASSQK